ncbi:MAG: hypothetical protein AAGJ08_22810 [Cyanobacteria bacterium P01_H01_bin.35]
MNYYVMVARLVCVGLLIFIKMLAEDPRSPLGERRHECQSILRFYKKNVNIQILLN